MESFTEKPLVGERFTLCILLMFTLMTVVVASHQHTSGLNWVSSASNFIEVSSEEINFEVERGGNKTVCFTVRNVAETPLNVSISWDDTSSAYKFIVTPQTFVLDVNRNQTVTITVVVSDNAERGLYENKLTVTAYPST